MAAACNTLCTNDDDDDDDGSGGGSGGVAAIYLLDVACSWNSLLVLFSLSLPLSSRSFSSYLLSVARRFVSTQSMVLHFISQKITYYIYAVHIFPHAEERKKLK